MPDQHNCVLMESGAVKCWGFNRMGQVGNGSFSEAVTLPGMVNCKWVSLSEESK